MLEVILAVFRGLKTPIALRMSAYDYADIRKFGRDLLEIEMDSRVWKTGIMGRYDGVEIRCSRSEDRDQISVVAMCGHLLAVAKVGTSMRLLPGTSDHAVDCVDCLAHSVMSS